MIRSIPLLLLVVIAYNIIVFITGPEINATAFAFNLPSSIPGAVSVGELLVGIGLILLYFEVLKATRTSTAAIIDHLLSMAVFVICLVEYILVPQCGTGAFLLITLMTLIDVIAGFTVSISTARRDFGVDQQLGHG